MKKIVLMLVAILTATLSVNAQNVESGNNWGVSLNIGAAAPMAHAFDFTNHGNLGFSAYRAKVGGEIQCYVTPVVGFSESIDAYINTTGSKRWIDNTNLSTNVKVNIGNLLAGYPGNPRAVEFVAVAGFGWAHSYGTRSTPKPEILMARDFLTTKVGAEVNVNLGASEAWQISVRPEIVYGNWGKHGLDAREGIFQASVGLVHKFNSKKNAKKSHNFILVEPQTIEVTREVPVEKVVEKVVEKQTTVQVPVVTTQLVTFAKSSSELTDEAKAILNQIPSGSTVAIEATASPEGTSEFNQTLSEARANVVKDFLQSKGIKVSDAVGKGVTGETSQRIAKIILK